MIKSVDRSKSAISKSQALEQKEAQHQAMAERILNPSLGAAATMSAFIGENDWVDSIALMDALTDKSDRVINSGIRNIEAILVTQAHTLDLIFNTLASKAANTDNINKLDSYLRLALKAQSQCRATLQTLGELKNPPLLYAKQANITNGPQQINNGVTPSTTTHARENKIQQNELLEQIPNEQLDTRAPSKAGGANQAVEAMAKIDRADNGRR